jgi:RNA-directed DNA polymerase
MPEDAPVNIGAPDLARLCGPWSWVSGMQTKLHHWPTADPGGRFDDLFNFVYDPATLLVAFDRVADNTGANTPGVDGLTVTRWRPASGCWVAPRDIRPAETSIMR